ITRLGIRLAQRRSEPLRRVSRHGWQRQGLGTGYRIGAGCSVWRKLDLWYDWPTRLRWRRWHHCERSGLQCARRRRRSRHRHQHGVSLMAAFDFPNSPTPGQRFVPMAGGIEWMWDGSAWISSGGSALGMQIKRTVWLASGTHTFQTGTLFAEVEV